MEIEIRDNKHMIINKLTAFRMALPGLIAQARKTAASHLSYRNFPVGAAVLAESDDGRLEVFTGANHKSGPGTGRSKGCAEPTAVKAARDAGYPNIVGIAVVGRPQEEFPTPTLHPCGECRDFFTDLKVRHAISDNAPVVSVHLDNPAIIEQFTLGELLGYYSVRATSDFFHERLQTQIAGGTITSPPLWVHSHLTILTSHKEAGTFHVPSKPWLYVPMSPDRATLFAGGLWNMVSLLGESQRGHINAALVSSSGGDFGLARLLAHHPQVEKATAIVANKDEVERAAQIDGTKLTHAAALETIDSQDLIILEYMPSESSPTQLRTTLEKAYGRVKPGGALHIIDLNGNSFLYTGGEDTVLPLTIEPTHPRFPHDNLKIAEAQCAWVIWRPSASVSKLDRSTAWLVGVDDDEYVGTPSFAFWRHRPDDIIRLMKSIGPARNELSFLEAHEEHGRINRAIELRRDLGHLFMTMTFWK